MKEKWLSIQKHHVQLCRDQKLQIFSAKLKFADIGIRALEKNGPLAMSGVQSYTN
jgi:hypothetical protein